jgi:pyruvate kinase
MAGADVFRLNFSHGEPDEHRARIEAIRALEKSTGRPIGILLDLQGPKLRVGRFANGKVKLLEGVNFRLDLDQSPGNVTRVQLPHPEIFAALEAGTDLLLDDGRIRLHVDTCGPNFAETTVKTGGTLTNNKGVNVPSITLPLSPITEKDERDLAFGLELGIDWVAASFVQRPEDLTELRERVGGRASIMTKLEKPSAVQALDEIVRRSDAVMVARGDLGVELPPEQVPRVQKQVVRKCRDLGKPVIVATQMLESMISAPIPTRAEASDVAAAVYDGADAVMLSAETAVGDHPVAAVSIMSRIIAEVEADPHYRTLMDANVPAPEGTIADAISDALRAIAHTLPVAAIVTYTSSGFSSLRAARERPKAPILSLTPHIATARRLSLAWGVHAVHSDDLSQMDQMVNDACEAAVQYEFAKPKDVLVIMAGLPFGRSGTTNLLRVAEVP